MIHNVDVDDDEEEECGGGRGRGEMGEETEKEDFKVAILTCGPRRRRH